MFFKSFCLFFILLILNIQGSELDYTYNAQIDGWLKLYEPTNCSEAWSKCVADGGTIASPVNGQLRAAVNEYLSGVSESASTVFSGVHDEFGVDFFTPEEQQGINDCDSPDSCVAWAHGNNTVRLLKCDEVLPFVCLKRKPLPTASSYCANPDYTYDARSGSCYKFHRRGETWPVADDKCKVENAYLTVIKSELEARVLRDLFASIPSKEMDIKSIHYDQAWVGIRDVSGDEHWKTITGETLAQAGYSVWGLGEPSSPGRERCGSIFRQATFNDAPCDLNLAFICEMEPSIVKHLPALPTKVVKPAPLKFWLTGEIEVPKINV